MGGKLELFFTSKHLLKSLMNSFFQLPVQPSVLCKDATQTFPHTSVYLKDRSFLRTRHCLYLWVHLRFNWVGWTMSLLVLLHRHSFPSNSLPSYNRHPCLDVFPNLSFVILINQTLTHSAVHQGTGKKRWQLVGRFRLALDEPETTLSPLH